MAHSCEWAGRHVRQRDGESFGRHAASRARSVAPAHESKRDSDLVPPDSRHRLFRTHGNVMPCAVDVWERLAGERPDLGRERPRAVFLPRPGTCSTILLGNASGPGAANRVDDAASTSGRLRLTSARRARRPFPLHPLLHGRSQTWLRLAARFREPSGRAAVTSIASRERFELSRQSMRQPLVP